MFRNSHSFFLVALSLLVPAGSLMITGCSKGEAPPEPSADNGGRMGGPGGPGGGPGGPGGGRMAPVAADAKGADIFGMKCAGCHGSKGEGAKGPNLQKEAGTDDAKLFSTIHDGKGRMPAFGTQMTEAQMNDLVKYVKGLGAA